MLGLIIWPIVAYVGAVTEKWWPDGVRNIAIVTILLVAFQMLNLPRLNAARARMGEPPAVLGAPEIGIAVVAVLLQVTVVFAIGWAIGALIRRARRK